MTIVTGSLVSALPPPDDLPTGTLRAMIADNMKPPSGMEREGQTTTDKDEWLGLMKHSPARVQLDIPISFCLMWAAKQDWPLTWLQTMDVNVAWWQQFIDWRKAGGEK